MHHGELSIVGGQGVPVKLAGELLPNARKMDY
jgi:hypothetical protein